MNFLKTLTAPRHGDWLFGLVAVTFVSCIGMVIGIEYWIDSLSYHVFYEDATVSNLQKYLFVTPMVMTVYFFARGAHLQMRRSKRMGY